LIKIDSDLDQDRERLQEFSGRFGSFRWCAAEFCLEGGQFVFVARALAVK
jgi:hypothetical protein